MKKKLKLASLSSIFLPVFILFCSICFGQNFKITTSLGASSYQGDLASSGIGTVKPAASVGLSYSLLDNLRLRANFTFLQVGADDSKATKQAVKERNLSFESNIYEGALLAELDLLNSENYTLIPYVFVGTSVYHFNPYTTVKATDVQEAAYLGYNNLFKVGDKIYLHDIGTGGQLFSDNSHADRRYDLTQINFQLGGGLRYKISESLSIGYELNLRKLSTDWLDDVSTQSYVGRTEWESHIKSTVNPNTQTLLKQGEVLSWKILDQNGNPQVLPNSPDQPRGNPKANDAYLTLQIRLNFTLFNSNTKHKYGNNKFFSPRNPSGMGQLICPKPIF